jgi:hypothetical protein
VVGAKMAKKILTDLKFPQKVIEKVTKLIRWHMFFPILKRLLILPFEGWWPMSAKKMSGIL